MVGFNRAIVALSVTSLLGSFVHGHPGESKEEKLREIRERSEYLATLENTDVAHCAPKLAKRGDLDKTVERRQNILRQLRRERGLDVEGMASGNLRWRVVS
jgi:hypothetical protein